MSTYSSSSEEGWLNSIFILGVSVSLFFIVGFVKENVTTEATVPNNRHFSISSSVISKNEIELDKVVLYSDNTILASSPPTHHKPQTVALGSQIRVEKRWIEITGYSSTVDQTNSEPFITASGAWVRDGIVAANFLPFGTRIRIPELFGDKIFVVKDRMNRRYSPPYDNVWHDGYVDVWFSTRQEARNLGRRTTYIEIIR